MDERENNYVSITPLLQRLANSSAIVSEIVNAVALIFHNKLSPVQSASLLSLLRITGRDQEAAVIAQCAARMREAGSPVDCKLAQDTVKLRMHERAEGSYRGGLCTIEGTGGDGYSTFNVSTAASIVASTVVFVAKHGAVASSSKSGAADVLRAIEPTAPILEAVTSASLPKFYENGSFVFLFSPIFHPGMRYVAQVRKELGFKTIFNILGPLAHPLNPIMEARVVGVAQRHLGPVYAEALKMSGVKKALVVCGAEDLDEISCAGPTFCWRLIEDTHHGFDEAAFVRIEEFQLEPADFGLPVHSLLETPLGKLPTDNAEILVQMMSGQLSKNDPTLQFVLINTAALFVLAGICDNDPKISTVGHRDFGEVITEIGPGGGRWKEGVRRARLALESGLALTALNQYINATRSSLL